MFLDFGLNFERSGMYFREFIKSRASRGINDHLEMGFCRISMDIVMI